MNKVALITGAATRLGRAMALHLAAKGYNLCIHCNSSKADAEECQRLAQEQGVEAMIIAANLSQDDEVAKIIPEVNAKLGEISLLINNASVFHSQKFKDTSKEQFTTDLAINLKAPFFLTQSFAAQATQKFAGEYLIVNITDSVHNKLSSNHFLYKISKHALDHFTMQAAKELAPQIRVNAIAPGPALPPPGKDTQYFDQIAKNTPLGIASPPETLLDGLDYLMQAKSVTGQVLYIGSGMHLT
ncbi:MAG: SDR family NAD(P)-dependent oxidoreductase [Candidatus Portiera sp.]|nr:SDR family NAD(P)-dependent oxidoreductase [Portiera sp.]